MSDLIRGRFSVCNLRFLWNGRPTQPRCVETPRQLLQDPLHVHLIVSRVVNDGVVKMQINSVELGKAICEASGVEIRFYISHCDDEIARLKRCAQLWVSSVTSVKSDKVVSILVCSAFAHWRNICWQATFVDESLRFGHDLIESVCVAHFFQHVNSHDAFARLHQRE